MLLPTWEERLTFNQRIKECFTTIFSGTITNDERNDLVNRLERIFYHFHNTYSSSNLHHHPRYPPNRTTTTTTTDSTMPTEEEEKERQQYQQILWATEWIQYLPYLFQAAVSVQSSSLRNSNDNTPSSSSSGGSSSLSQLPPSSSPDKDASSIVGPSLLSSSSSAFSPVEYYLSIVYRFVRAIMGYGDSVPFSSSSVQRSILTALFTIVRSRSETEGKNNSSIASSSSVSGGTNLLPPPLLTTDVQIFQTLIQILVTLPEQIVSTLHKLHTNASSFSSSSPTLAELLQKIPVPLQSVPYFSRFRYDIHHILIQNSTIFEQFLTSYTTTMDLNKLLPESTDNQIPSTSSLPSTVNNIFILRWLRNYQLTVEKLSRIGQLSLFYQDWVQTAYFYSGMGAIQLHTQYRVDTSNLKDTDEKITIIDRPEFPNATGQYNRARQISYLSTYLLYLLDLNCSQGYGNLSAIVNNIILTCHGITLDYISCTPEAGKLVPPCRIEGSFGEYGLGLLLIILGNKSTLPKSIHAYLQNAIITSTVLPSITLRNVISYLLFPHVLPVKLAYQFCKNTSALESWYSTMRESPSSSLAEGRGYLSTIESSSLSAVLNVSPSTEKSITLTEWFDNFPLMKLVELWSQSSTILHMNNNLQRNLTLCILFTLPMVPSEAFLPSCPLLSSLMIGIQHRLDLPYNAEQLQWGLAVAETFSKRYTPNSPFVFSMDELTTKVRSKEKDANTTESSTGNENIDGTRRNDETPTSTSFVVRRNDEETFQRALDRFRNGYPRDSFTTLFSNEVQSPKEENIASEGISTTTSNPITAGSSTVVKVSSVITTEDSSLTAARRHFAMKAPVYLYQAYIRLMTYMKEESGSTDNNALPIPGGGALDEDSSLVSSGGPEATIALFATLERLIRQASEDTTGTGQNQLLELCVPLLKCLLTIQNRYNEPNFPIWRFNSIVALCVCATPMATQYLFSQFHLTNNPTVSEGLRLEILDILVASANELQGENVATVPTPLPPWEDPDWRPEIINDFDTTTTMTDTPAIPAQRKKDTTVNQSSKERKKDPSPLLPNFFSSLAMDYFFNPLFRILLESKTNSSTFSSSSLEGLTDPYADDDTSTTLGMKELFTSSTLLTGSRTNISGKGESFSSSSSSLIQAYDPVLPSSVDNDNLSYDLHSSHDRLLAQSLRALAVFIEFTSTDRSVIRMVRSLLPLAWYLRNRSDANLRAACLSSIAACIAGIHKHENALLLSPSVLTGLGSHEGSNDDNNGNMIGKGQSSSGIRKVGTTSSVLKDLSSIGKKLQKESDLQRIAKEITDGSAPSLSSVEHRKTGIPQRNDTTEHTMANVLLQSSNEPTVWDDLIILISWLRLLSTTDPDPVCRQLALQIVQNPLLKELVLGPLSLEDIEQLQ